MLGANTTHRIQLERATLRGMKRVFLVTDMTERMDSTLIINQNEKTNYFSWHFCRLLYSHKQLVKSMQKLPLAQTLYSKTK